MANSKNKMNTINKRENKYNSDHSIIIQKESDLYLLKLN